MFPWSLRWLETFINFKFTFKKIKSVAYSSQGTCCPWSHGLRPKKLSVGVVVPSAPVRVPSQRPLAPRVASVTSVANDKDNEMILGLCTDLLAFALQLSKTLENLS